jgi:acetate kinase
MLMQHSGLSLEAVLARLSTEAGLLGLSGGLSGDIRDLESAASQGNADAQLALDVYIAEVRRQLGGMLVALGRVQWAGRIRVGNRRGRQCDSSQQ